MTTLELIAHVGGVNQYCKYVSEWSNVVMLAHQQKHKSDYFNRKYRSITVEYYILRMSPHKTTRPYHRKAPVDSIS